MKTTLRTAYPKDASQLSEMARAMVTEMASHGGYPVSMDDSNWANLTDTFTNQIEAPDFCYIVAESTQVKTVGFASGEARTLGECYAPKKLLHITAVYVLPAFRHFGLGELLVKALLDWGRENNCVEAELNVVEGNPAVLLYEKLNFVTFRRTLVRSL